MNYRVAIITNGIVINTLAWDGTTPLTYSEPWDRIAVVDTAVGIGDVDNGDGTFTRPAWVELEDGQEVVFDQPITEK